MVDLRKYSNYTFNFKKILVDSTSSPWMLVDSVERDLVPLD